MKNLFYIITFSFLYTPKHALLRKGFKTGNPTLSLKKIKKLRI